MPDVERAIDELSKVVEITPSDRRRFRKLEEESKNFESLPIRTRLTDEEVARFAVNRYRFPGVEIRARLFRHYPHGRIRLARHRLHRPHQRCATSKRIEAAGLAANYKGTDHIGKPGSRAPTKADLHGMTGFEQVEIDAGGRARADAVAHGAACPATTWC